MPWIFLPSPESCSPSFKPDKSNLVKRDNRRDDFMGGVYNDLIKDMDIEEKDMNSYNRVLELEMPIKIKDRKLYSKA